MAIRYYKLFDLLQRRGIKKMEFCKLADISSPTMAKLSAGANINTEIINRICSTLEVQPGDIMEYAKEE
ncbi:helix-turn-helix transcriptional regulator [Phascolarctobacterium faecium]|nr:helix-turn-helix transcriptional regulator [Phascolarctobacterium faecium]MDM8111776.1 helix-turn-helix transcriptional regulator [Phascolarctobacterium faecium]